MKWIGTLFIFLVIFSFAVGFSNRKTDLYENMVNASVYIRGCGSGVFIYDDVILTAAHVLEDEKSVTILFSDGTKLKSSDFWKHTRGV